MVFRKNIHQLGYIWSSTIFLRRFCTPCKGNNIPAQWQRLGEIGIKYIVRPVRAIYYFVILQKIYNMPQSLSKLYVHIVFHIKNNDVIILPKDEKELYAYISGIIKANEAFPIAINGTENHIHILTTLSKNVALAKFVEEIKRNSSRWIKTKGDHYQFFAWQGGYAGYSVSQSKVAIVEKYIENQKEHHKIETFHNEYVKFLKEYKVDFDEKHLWS